VNRDEAEIRTIDARIASATVKQRDFGTVITRATTGPGATVLFDNASTPQPVKVLGHVHCFAGDRVALELFKTTWVVVGSFARKFLGETYNALFGPSGAANTSSATFVDMPSNVTCLLAKRYDDTLIQLRLTATMWTNTTGTEVVTGVRIQGTPGTETATTFTPIDVGMATFQFNIVSVRLPTHGQVRDVTMPAGSYTLTARWRRPAGAGVLIMDNRDLTILEADERFGAGS
jgi:hypothetical protein